MATITTSENGYVSVPSQVIDGVTTPSYKWFSLQDNKLDGTYHPMNVASQIGWWGSSLSDSLGTLSSAPAITVDFGQLQSINSVQVVGDSLLGEYPVDFTIKFYNGTTLVYTDTITGNALVTCKRYYASVIDCTKYVVTITKVNKATRSIKLLQGADLGQVNRIDTLLPKVVDILTTLGSQLTSSDTITPRVDDLYKFIKANLVDTDVLLPKADDLDKIITGKLFVTEVLTPKVDDLDLGQDVSFLSTEIITPKMDDVDLGQTVRFTKTEVLTPITDEGISDVTAAILDTDLLTPNMDDLLSYKLFGNIDTLLLKTGDLHTYKKFTVIDTIQTNINDVTSDITASIMSVDTLTPYLTEFLLMKSFTSLDTVLTKLSNVSQAVRANLSSVESLLVRPDDTVVTIRNSFSSSDTILPRTDESKYVTALLYRNDQLLVHYNIEGTQVTVDLYANDQVQIIFTEDKQMTNVYTKMDEPARQVFGKVEITYTDPFMDQSISATANDTAPYTDPAQTADNLKTTAYKWFTLYDNKLDGSAHPMDSTGQTEVGWWSNSLSNADGSFDVAPQLTIQFDPRGIILLKVIGDSVVDVYPVDFNIACYDISNNLLRSVDVVNNTSVSWLQDISSEPVLNSAKMVLTVTKINKPGYQCRILEFITSVVQTYTGDDRVVLINLLEEREITDGSLPVGNITSNEIDIRLDNTDRYFDPATATSPLSTLLKPNRRIKAWLGVAVIPGQVEWHKLGTFWTTAWSSPKADVVTSVTARDRFNLMSRTEYRTSGVKINVSLGTLAEDILLDYGLTVDEFAIAAELYNMNVPVAWFDKMSHREALRKVAEAGLAVAYCDSEAKVIVGAPVVAAYPLTTLAENTNVFDYENPQDWTQVVNDIGIKWNPLIQEAPQEVLGITQLAIPIDPGTSVTMDLEFNKKPCSDVGTITIGGGADLQLTDSKIYAWGVQITAYNAGTVVENLDSVHTTGTPWTTSTYTVNRQDVNSIRDLGKLSYSLDNHLIQTVALAITIADQLIATYSDPLRKVFLNTRGNIGLELGDRITLPIKGDGVITRQTYTYDGTLSGTVEALKI